MDRESNIAQNDKVSVLISTYNRAHYLAKSIESALGQTYDNFEIIVADDGSTDGTATLCAGYGDRIKYVCHGKNGLGKARQLALLNATGEFLAWLDDDDRWMPGKLEKMVKYLKDHPQYDWAHSDAIEVDGKDNVINESYLKQFGSLKMEGDVYKGMLLVCFPLTSTVVMRKRCMEELGGFETSENYGADVDLYLRCSLHHPIGIVREPIVMRLLHERGSERANNVYDEYSQISCRIPIFERILKRNIDFSADQRDETVGMLALYRYRLGELHWRDLDFGTCRHLFLQSMDWNSRSVRALLYVVLTFSPPSAVRILRRIRQSPRQVT